jgi:hypothetical protein
MEIPDFVPKDLPTRTKKPERRTAYLSSSSGESVSGEDDGSDEEGMGEVENMGKTPRRISLLLLVCEDGFFLPCVLDWDAPFSSGS